MPTPQSENHRRVAEKFSAVVHGVNSSWDGATPVPEWRARDIVGHLVEWFPALLATGSDIRLPDVPSIDDDPVAAWDAHCSNLQALLDDPATTDLVLRNPHFGEVSVPDAVDQFYTPDVFMHTWDLAKATGQDVTLDADTCEAMLDGMKNYEDAMRRSAQYGPRVEVPADSSPQDRLVAFIGRDPAWRRPE
jgi:uncharacterized protein (TIGR03086 family)